AEQLFDALNVGGLLPGDHELAAPAAHLDAEPALDELQILIVGAAKGPDLVVVGEVDARCRKGFRGALTQSDSYSRSGEVLGGAVPPSYSNGGSNTYPPPTLRR